MRYGGSRKTGYVLNHATGSKDDRLTELRRRKLCWGVLYDIKILNRNSQIGTYVGPELMMGEGMW